MEPTNIRRRTVLTGLVTGALGGTGVGQAAAVGGRGTGRYVVGTAGRAGKRAARAEATSVVHDLDLGPQGGVVAGHFPEQALDGLRNRPDVRYVEPDIPVHAVGETLPEGIDRVDADEAHADGATGEGADIAIIDTGIDADHPDLSANLGDGYAVYTCSGDCPTAWSDDNGHGTHCAGIADAADNTEGVIGVSTAATLHSVKVLESDGTGYSSDVAAGIEWVGDQGYDVGSISLGSAGSSSAIRDACQYAADRGVLLVAAAGNDGPCTDCVIYPAAYDTVVAVSAVNDSDDLADFSCTGPEIELAAPGVGVYSTYLDDDYASLSGTSMACPHVSGAAGQLVASGLSASEARRRLRDSAEDLGLGENEQGNGLLDVENALATSTDTSVAVSTGSASGVGETTATLSGTLDDLGGASSAEVAFEWGEAGAGFPNTTAAETLSSTGSFSASLDGLASGTDHEFRAIVTASDGDTDTGGTASFTTDTDPTVVVSTGSASGVGETTATLSGTLDDLGGASSAEVAFEWGEAGTTLSNTASAGTLSSTGGFAAEVSGLTSGTEYEFRAVADASDGDTDTGGTASFTTDSTNTDTAPAVDSYTVVEAGSPNPHAEITADWDVSDVDGDLDSVTVAVLDSSGRTVDASGTDVSGSTASGSDSFTVKHARGATYDVRLTVSDAGGNATSATRTVTE